MPRGRCCRRAPASEGQLKAKRKFKCDACNHTWEEPYGTGRPTSCPTCGSTNIHRAPEDRGCARRGKPPSS